MWRPCGDGCHIGQSCSSQTLCVSVTCILGAARKQSQSHASSCSADSSWRVGSCGHNFPDPCEHDLLLLSSAACMSLLCHSNLTCVPPQPCLMCWSNHSSGNQALHLVSDYFVAPCQKLLIECSAEQLLIEHCVRHRSLSSCVVWLLIVVIHYSCTVHVVLRIICPSHNAHCHAMQASCPSDKFYRRIIIVNCT